MGKIIQFRTREEIECEKKKNLLEEWNAYLEWERETMKRIQKENTLDLNTN